MPILLRIAPLLILFVISGLAACDRASDPVLLAEPVPMTIQVGPTVEGPRLSQGRDGQIVLSWMERLSIGGGALHFSELEDGSWKNPTTVINDPRMFVNWADTPSVVPLAGDNWFAHWLSKTGKSTYAYGIQVSHSTDGGATWSSPIAPHSDGTPTEHGFVSVSPGDDTTQLIWLDGRKMVNEVSDDVAATSMTLRGATVDANGGIANAQLIDDVVCDCCSTEMATTLTGRVAVYRNRTTSEIRDIYSSRQVNGEWQQGQPLSNDGWEIAGCPVNGPAVAASDNFVAVAWFTAANDEPKVQLRLSQDAGQSFGESILISADNVMGQVDVEVLNGDSVVVSWLAENAQGSGDIRLATVSEDGKAGEETVGTTNYPRAVPQMTLDESGLLLAWTDREEDGNRLRTVRVPFVD